MKLFLDDLREPRDVYGSGAEKSWVVARTYEACVSALKSGVVKEISLDNDLGLSYEGLDVAHWILNQVRTDKSFHCPIIRIHTANIVARRRMEGVLKDIRRLQSGEFD